MNDQALEILARSVQAPRITTTLTASATLDTSQVFVRADTTTGAFTITLPAASQMQGQTVTIAKVETSAHAATVDASGAETINGALTFTLPASMRSAVLLRSNGTSWDLLAFATGDGPWLPLAGGTLSGLLTAAAKAYVGGPSGQYAFQVYSTDGGAHIRLAPMGGGAGAVLDVTNAAESAYEQLQVDSPVRLSNTVNVVGVLVMSNQVAIERAAAGDTAIYTVIPADTVARFVAQVSGALEWGPGNAARDVSLYRNGIGLLQLNGSLDVSNGLTVHGTLNAPHATSHAAAGSDPLTIAESQVTNLVADLAAKASTASLAAHTGDATIHVPTSGTTGHALIKGASGASFQSLNKRVFYYSGVDLTYPASSTTATGLTIAVDAGQSWYFSFELVSVSNATTAGGVQFKVTGPAASTGYFLISGTNTAGTFVQTSVNLGANSPALIASGASSPIRISGYVNTTTTAGNVALSVVSGAGTGGTVFSPFWVSAFRNEVI